MNKQREALEMALLALEIAPLDHNSVKSTFFEKRHYAIIALREALAEPINLVQEAAPDLLEALNAMLEYTASLNAIQGFEEYDHAAVKQACAAIAKAKGEA